MDSLPAPAASPAPVPGAAAAAVSVEAGVPDSGPAAAEPLQGETTRREKPARRETAESLATRQREISVSEFFTKNRHLLGFDNPQKALLTAIKEAVDNSLDACEEAGILPVLKVYIDQLAEDRFRIAVQDNGPGIVKSQIPKIFGKLLYGSKFHALKQARGQQGIGISAAGMYGLLTTGKSIAVTSRTGPGKPAHYYEIQIDTRKNAPQVITDTVVEWEPQHGTRVEIELVGTYKRGRHSVDDYIRQTAIANPHA
jgi:DNA topoisomerase-6 subunit B